MHISEGVLAMPVLAAGAALTAAGTAIGLKRIDYDKLPRVALLAAVFFVAGLIHVPIGPGNAHLMAGGILGLILGWAVFPAMLVALALQGILFQYGGLVVLGLNTFNMAFPALLCAWLFRPMLRKNSPALIYTAGLLAGAGTILGGALMTALSLYLSGDVLTQAAGALTAAHLPIMVVEGGITGLVTAFLQKVRPGMFDGDTG